jgi:hypothetical protein
MSGEKVIYIYIYIYIIYKYIHTYTHTYMKRCVLGPIHLSGLLYVFTSNTYTHGDACICRPSKNYGEKCLLNQLSELLKELDLCNDDFDIVGHSV